MPKAGAKRAGETVPDGTVLDPALRRLVALGQERARAAPVLAALRAGHRTWPDLSDAERRLLRGAPLIDFLLAESFALRYRDPEGMVALAEVARQVAERISPRRYGGPALADLRARVWAELGNAYRVADDLFSAEEALGCARGWLRRGTGDARLAARLGDLAASLLADQRRFDAAVSILEQVRALYKDLDEPYLAARALASQGIFTGYADRPLEAVQLLLRSLRSLRFAGDTRLERQVFHNIGWFLVDAGLFTAARVWLEEIRWPGRRDRSRLNRLRREWLHGRIAAGLGEVGRAETAFHVARLGFKYARKPFDAALVSLDLALLWARQGRRLETRRLAQEMIATFGSLGIARESIASLIVLQKSCGQSSVSRDQLCGQIQAISALVADLQHRPVRRKAARR